MPVWLKVEIFIKNSGTMSSIHGGSYLNGVPLELVCHKSQPGRSCEIVVCLF